MSRLSDYMGIASIVNRGSDAHSNHGGHGSHGGNGNSPMCNMNMLFTWNTTDLCVVFKWWHVRTNIGLLLTLAAIVLLSSGYEFVRYRIRILDNEVSNSTQIANSTVSNNYRLRQSIGYALQVGYSYLLMLIFMTYNGWAMLAVSLGAGLGFWFWGDKAQKSMSCH